MTTFTLVEPSGVHAFDAHIEGHRVLVDRTALAGATGWDRKPEGLCRGDVCIPVGPGAGLDVDEHVDLAAFARVLRRPLALDSGASAAFLGESAATRTAALDSLIAPDFSLPDLEGRMHSLSEHKGKKVFLVAWASW